MRYVLFVLLGAMFFVGQSVVALEYGIDYAHSAISFKVKHLAVSSVRGEFRNYTTTMNWDETDLEKSRFEGLIDVKSITTGNHRRDKHLRSSDFFEAKTYPNILYKSTKIIKGSKENAYVVVGALTMKNITKTVTGNMTVSERVKDNKGNFHIGFEAILKVNRRDFGITYENQVTDGTLVVGEIISIELSLEGIHRKNP